MPRSLIDVQVYSPPDINIESIPESIDSQHLYVKDEKDNSRKRRSFYYGPPSSHILSGNDTPLIQSHDARFCNTTMRHPPSPANSYDASILPCRVLPPKILNPPFSEEMIQSVWFKSGPCDDRDINIGVSMVDMLSGDVESCLNGANDEVLKNIVSNDEIRFDIFWPSYGYRSWIAKIPTMYPDRDGKRTMNITRSKLGSIVARHFRAFMTHNTMLHLRHPDPLWKISNEGIRFEQLRLMRLFCCNVGKGDGNDCDAWQAEVLVVGM